MEGFGNRMRRVVDIPAVNLMAVISDQRRMFVFKIDGCAGLVLISENRCHVSPVYSHRVGEVRTWLGSSGKALETLQVVGSMSMCKLNDTDLG